MVGGAHTYTHKKKKKRNNNTRRQPLLRGVHGDGEIFLVVGGIEFCVVDELGLELVQ